MFIHKLRAVFSAIYLHVAAVLGALSLASLLAEVRILEWRGVVLDLVTWWADTARPAVDFLFLPFTHFLSLFFNFDVVLPPLVQDYLGVGCVLVFSRLRGSSSGWTAGGRKAVRSIASKPLAAIRLLLRTVFLWPVELALMSRNLLFARSRFPERSDEEIRQIRYSHFLGLLVVFYCLALVALNWVVFFLPDLLRMQKDR